MENRPILVAYASRAGSTREVAEAIGQTLSEHGARAEVRSVTDITDLRPYRAVILGSAVHAGKWLPEAVKFVERYRTDLLRTPLVYFLVCGTLREDTPEHHRELAGRQVEQTLGVAYIEAQAGRKSVTPAGHQTQIEAPYGLPHVECTQVAGMYPVL